MSQHGLNGNPGRRSSPGRRYRRLLISLAAAAVVPMMVYGSVQCWLRANAERRALDATNLEEAQRLALLVDNELMAELNGLRMLSLSHELDTDNLGGFYDLARRAHFENELWRSVIVIDPNTNEILLNTLFPIGSPYQPVQDPETVREVFEQHNAVIGAPTRPGLVQGTNRMHPAFVPLRVPVLRGDEMHYVLSASMSPDQLRALLWNVSPLVHQGSLPNWHQKPCERRYRSRRECIVGRWMLRRRCLPLPQHLFVTGRFTLVFP